MSRPIVLAVLETKRFLASKAELALAFALPMAVFAAAYFGIGPLAMDGSDSVALVLTLLTTFMVLWLTLAAQTLVKERRNGTLERLLTTRLRINELFIGRFLGGLSRGVLQGTVLLLLAFLVLRPAGPLTYLQAVFFAAILAGAVSAVALLLAAIVRTRVQGVSLALLFTALMAMLGSAFSQPAEGTTMYVLSHFTITKYASEGLHAIIAEGHLGAAGEEAAILGIILVASLALARWVFRVSPIRRSMGWREARTTARRAVRA